MKCKNCRYLSKEDFENTNLRTCNVAYYLIKKYKKEGNRIYLTDALTSEDRECKFSVILKNGSKYKFNTIQEYRDFIASLKKNEF